jgi:hypothetical protein
MPKRTVRRAAEELAREESMTGVLNLLTVALGGFTAYVSERFPVTREALEAAAGFMLLGGFAAIGCALPAMV